MESRTVCLVLLAFIAFARGSLAAEESALVGTWYILVHYKTPLSSNPDADHWQDFVWNFEMSGSRLRWTQYPIVVFDDAHRFELTQAGRTRSLAAWEPDEAGWAYLARGPRVNNRGSKSKTLRGSDDSGWSSFRRRSGGQINVFTYEEDWTITELAEGGRIRIDDVVSSGTTADGTGDRTIFAIEQVGQNEFRGKYDRDGTRLGTFLMRRVGSVRDLQTSEDGLTPNERLGQRARQAILDRLERSAAEGSLGEQEWPWEKESGFPTMGSSVDQVVSGIRSKPAQGTNVITQKLLIFRVDSNPWLEISETRALSGSVDPAGTYAIMANRHCIAVGEKQHGESRTADWFLLQNDRLEAYKFDRLGGQCAAKHSFQPAEGSLGETEAQITTWMKENFPTGTKVRPALYQRGISYLSAGRIDDAEKMLEAGRRTHFSGTEKGGFSRGTAASGEGVITKSEVQMLEQALARAIRAAREAQPQDSGE